MASRCLQLCIQLPFVRNSHPSVTFDRTDHRPVPSVKAISQGRPLNDLGCRQLPKRFRDTKRQHLFTHSFAETPRSFSAVDPIDCSQNVQGASSSSLIGHRDDGAGLSTSGPHPETGASTSKRPLGEASKESQLELGREREGGNGSGGDIRDGGGTGGGDGGSEGMGGGGVLGSPFWPILARSPGFFPERWDHTQQPSKPSRHGEKNGNGSGNENGKKALTTSPPVCTRTLIGLNVLLFGANILSGDLLLFLGAKVNALIDRGQWWRLLTPALLHRDLLHLAVNTYSMLNLGTSVEGISGSGWRGKSRFLAVYWLSAISGNLFSYRFNKFPAVGSSTALFGMIGAVAMYRFRHRQLAGESWKAALKGVGINLGLNLALGWKARGIDNWGHLGGLLGGLATAWLLGPDLRLIAPPDMAPALVDIPPIMWVKLYLTHTDVVKVINHWILY